MRFLEFYIITKDNTIKLSNKFSQDDLVFILDGKLGYIWKGDRARDLDELSAKKIEQLIREKYPDINFGLITNLEITNGDTPKNTQIKTEIKNRLPSLIVDTIKEKSLSPFKKIKKNISEFKDYENSRTWRKNLSNLTNLWKLSILNIVIIAVSIMLMFNQTRFFLTYGDFYSFIALLSLSIILIINIIFVVFPMKFPYEPISFGDPYKTSSTQISEREIPPKPVFPEILTDESRKHLEKGEKPAVKQLQLEPLKVKDKKEKKGKGKEKIGDTGVEYLSDEDKDLGIPAMPEAPKKMRKITIEDPGLSTDIIEKMKGMESKDIEGVLVDCERCKVVILIPIPKKAVLKSPLPVVPISYVHANKDNKDPHCITIHIDHDFDIRRQYISDVAHS